MKVYILSDIHGSPVGLSEVLKKFDIDGDQLWILGDILYHGPRNNIPEGYDPKKVIALLNERKDKIIAVRGNCDAEVDQMVLDFPITADYNIIMQENKRIFMSHGHVYSPDKMPVLHTGDAFLFGHVHLPICERREANFILNPGSITLPKQNNPQSYATLENGCFMIWDLAGNCVNSIQLF